MLERQRAALPPQRRVRRIGPVGLGDGLGVAGGHIQPGCAGHAGQRDDQAPQLAEHVVGACGVETARRGGRRIDHVSRALERGAQRRVVSALVQRCQGKRAGTRAEQPRQCLGGVGHHEPRTVGTARGEIADRPTQLMEPVVLLPLGQRRDVPVAAALLVGGLRGVDPVVRVLPRRQRQPHPRAAALRLPGRPRGVRGVEVGAERHGVVGVALQRRDAAVPRLGQGVLDRMCEQRMRAHLDEQRLLCARGGHRAGEADRVAQVGHPVFGVEHAGAVGGSAVGGDDDGDARPARGQTGECVAEVAEDRIDDGVV